MIFKTHNTQKEIAKDLNWSTGKVAMADLVLKNSNEDTKDKLRSGETSINKEYKEIKKKTRWEKAEQGLNVLKKLKKEKEKIEYKIQEVEELLEKDFKCYKVTESCYLVGEGSIGDLYSELLNNLKL